VVCVVGPAGAAGPSPTSTASTSATTYAAPTWRDERPLYRGKILILHGYPVTRSLSSADTVVPQVDDLRAQFGRSFATEEVKTPHIDQFFLDGGGSAMQHSYVQIAVCGPSRSSMLTGRRPDTTHVGTGIGGWCWCQRTGCAGDKLFMTLPTWMRRHGFTTAGNGKLFHPDACKHFGFSHAAGDDPRAWSYRYAYGVEANVTQEQWGTIPGPHDQVFNGTMGLSFFESPLRDEEETDGILATNTVERLANFSKEEIGKPGADRPFFLSTVSMACSRHLCDR
jgi:arylsulfatase A-like enzyme